MTARRHGLLSWAVDALHYATFAGSVALVRSLATSESYAPKGHGQAGVVSISTQADERAVPKLLDDLSESRLRVCGSRCFR